jgi:hypothetical protein
MPLYPRGE